MEQLIQARADFLMGQEFPAIELPNTGRYFLPEPYIVIDVMLHKLLHVLRGSATALSSNTVKLRLQSGAK